MPRATFDRLPASKRSRVERAALAEFASRPYAQANLERIAVAARVAKGSLYQYFTDKRDLFDHTVAAAFEVAWSRLRGLLTEAGGDCFAMLEGALRLPVVLLDEEPLVARLYLRVGFEEPGPAVERILEYNRTFQQEFFTRGWREGRLDPELDVAAAGFLLDAVATRVHLAILAGQSSPAALESLAEKLVRLLRAAFAPPTKEGTDGSPGLRPADRPR